MFESVVLRQQSVGSNPLDLGFLAEALLFYQKVHVAGNASMLEQLITACTPEVLIELHQLGLLEITFELTQMGMYSPNKNAKEDAYLPMAIAAHDHQVDRLLPKIIFGVIGHRERSQRLADQLFPQIKVVTHDQDVLRETNDAIFDAYRLAGVIPKLMSYRAPGYKLPCPLAIEVVRRGDCFRVDTNIDFDNASRFQTKKAEPPLGMVTILLDLLGIRDSLRLSATLQSELATGTVFAQVAQTQIDWIMQRRADSAEKIECFQQFVFEDSRSVREAVNAGERNFTEVLELLRKAERFKAWLKDRDHDKQLVKEYFKSVTATSWVDQLPAKVARWFLFTGLGLAADAMGTGGVGTAISVGLSAVDQFYIDRLLHGWKANQFVDGPMRSFVEGT